VGNVSPEKSRLMQVTEAALYEGISKARAGNHVHDISSAVQQHVEHEGFSVVRDLVGHGVGKNLHEEPAVPNFGRAGTGMILQPGMTLAIEPMVNFGTYKVYFDADGWTVRTSDGSPSAHFEHTILVKDGEPEILTV
jgi:methionyl aminopeptidase